MWINLALVNWIVLRHTFCLKNKSILNVGSCSYDDAQEEQNMMVKRTKKDLIEKFNQQKKFLKQACQLYDNGDSDNAILIAGHLRNILYDKRSSKSVLTQLGIKASLRLFQKVEGVCQ